MTHRKLGLAAVGAILAGLWAQGAAEAQERRGSQDPGLGLSISPRVGYVRETLSANTQTLKVTIDQFLGQEVITGVSTVNEIPPVDILMYGGAVGVNLPFLTGHSVVLSYFQGEGETRSTQADFRFSDTSTNTNLPALQASTATFNNNFERTDLELNYLYRLTGISSLAASAKYEVLNITLDDVNLILCELDPTLPLSNPAQGCLRSRVSTVRGEVEQSTLSLRAGLRGLAPLAPSVRDGGGLRPLLFAEVYGVAERVSFESQAFSSSGVASLGEPTEEWRPGVDFAVGAAIQLGAGLSLDARARNQWSAETDSFVSSSRTSFQVGLTARR